MGKSYSLSGIYIGTIIYIARVSSLEVVESVLHLINCCLLFSSFRSSPLLIVLKKKKKKKTLRDHSYSNTTYIIFPWSWIFRSFLSLLQGVYFYSFLCYLLLSLYYIIICSYMFAIMIQEERKWSIKDYICGCNRLIERLWVSKWSWSSFRSRLYYKVCISTRSCVICYCLYIILLCVHTCLQVWSMKKESEIFVQFNPHFLLPDSLNFCMQVFIEVYLVQGLNNCKYRSNTYY